MIEFTLTELRAEIAVMRSAIRIAEDCIQRMDDEVSGRKFSPLNRPYVADQARHIENQLGKLSRFIMQIDAIVHDAQYQADRREETEVKLGQG